MMHVNGSGVRGVVPLFPGEVPLGWLLGVGLGMGVDEVVVPKPGKGWYPG